MMRKNLVAFREEEILEIIEIIWYNRNNMELKEGLS